MVMTISPARGDDLERAEELTVRTSQLNSTGRTYSREQLAELGQSDDHRLLIARLEDRYGSYGRIGPALVETGDTHWTVKLLLTSCRVMSRGVGTVLLDHGRESDAFSAKRTSGCASMKKAAFITL
jgi:FkbH-like protein